MQVNFLTKLVALKPGKAVQEKIKNVMEGKDEGADNSSSDEEDTTGRTSGISGRVGTVLSITITRTQTHTLTHVSKLSLVSYCIDSRIIFPRKAFQDENHFLCVLECFLRLSPR